LHKLDALELYAENIYVVGKNSRNIELPKEDPKYEVSFKNKSKFQNTRCLNWQD
jgi:hypothetical protein